MKRRALEVFLVLFAVWPVVQHLLVRSADVDPWKLCGWAMYSAPGPMKTLRVVLIDDDGTLRPLRTEDYSVEERRLVDRFRERRRALGHLARADALARGVLEHHPEAAGVFVPVLTLFLDPSNALLEPRIESSTHWRDGRDDALELAPGEVERLFHR